VIAISSDDIGTLIELRSLRLDNNLIGSGFTGRTSRCLAKLRKLLELDLSCNLMSKLPEWDTMPTVLSFNVSHNQLSAASIDTIAKSFPNLWKYV
jgi:Leucine-rich repeat (LRR) protein